VPLSQEQQEFVDFGNGGHARLLAGPGTGKSFTSVAFLEALAALDPKPRCHMITFTRAATRELVEKVEESADITVRPPSTAHSFAMSLLMRAQSPGTLRMADDWEKRDVIQELIKTRMSDLGHPVNIRKVEQLTDEMAAGWQALDNSMLELNDQDPALAAAFVGSWKESARCLGFVHISEIPFKAVQLFQDEQVNPEVDILVVDEYQDLNHAEIELLRLLSSQATLIAIGDDDQSIYGWRNAAPDALLGFCTEYSAQPFLLSLCYRCAPEILAPANVVIAAATGRPAKPALTSPPDKSGLFAQVNFTTSNAEFAGVTQIVKARLDAGVSPDKIAILVRTKPTTYRNELRSHFDSLGIKLLSVDWAKDATKEPGVRRLLALGRLVSEPQDSLAWAALLKLTQGIGLGSVSKVYAAACDAPLSFYEQLMVERGNGYPSLSVAMRTRVSKAVDDVLAIVSQLNQDQQGAVLGEDGWGGWLLSYQGANPVSDDGQRLFLEVGTELMEESEEPALRDFVGQFGQRAIDLAENDPEAVRVMSMASSKGLTVDTAILLGIDDATMPAPRGDEDEERRILYVAMTRATDFCVITFAAQRTGPTAHIGTASGQRHRSPFLQGLPGVAAPVSGAAFLAGLIRNREQSDG
jgi:DNA helicase-2/ATP-dependent DNA helicase PcrA